METSAWLSGTYPTCAFHHHHSLALVLSDADDKNQQLVRPHLSQDLLSLIFEESAQVVQRCKVVSLGQIVVLEERAGEKVVVGLISIVRSNSVDGKKLSSSRIIGQESDTLGQRNHSDGSAGKTEELGGQLNVVDESDNGSKVCVGEIELVLVPGEIQIAPE